LPGAASPGRQPIAGLDLRGDENSYVAVVKDSTGCFNIETIYGDNNMINVNAHEIGHLLGAGHDLAVTAPGGSPTSPLGWYLFDDSHASVQVWQIFGFTLRLKSAVARRDSDILACSDPDLPCTQLIAFSASGGMNNLGTANFVAASVANYRPVPQAPPPCGLTKPTYVNGFVTMSCGLKLPEEIYVTEHYIYWGDSCPTASDYYVIAPVPINPQVYENKFIQSTLFHANFNTWHYVSSCAYGEGCKYWPKVSNN